MNIEGDKKKDVRSMLDSGDSQMRMMSIGSAELSNTVAKTNPKGLPIIKQPEFMKAHGLKFGVKNVHSTIDVSTMQ
jgi:hypothetical protein